MAESKNGAIVRQHVGWGHIPAQHAELIQQFYPAHLNPYLNYHRPCAKANVEINAKGDNADVISLSNTVGNSFIAALHNNTFAWT